MLSSGPRRLQHRLGDFHRIDLGLAARRVFNTPGGREALARELERHSKGDVVTAKLGSAGRMVRLGENWVVARQALDAALHVMDPSDKVLFERRLRSLRTASLTARPVFLALAESPELNVFLTGLVRKKKNVIGINLVNPIPVRRTDFERFWFLLSSRERNAMVHEARRVLGGKFASRAGEEE